MRGSTRLLVALALLAPLTLTAQEASPPPPIPPPTFTVAAAGATRVEANDNRRAAGRLTGGVLTVVLEARLGIWRPDGPDGPPLPVAAFAEPGAGPTTPGPLLRVPLGTEVRATVRNALAVPIRVYGLGARRGIDAVGVPIAPGASHAFRFRATEVGLSYYLAAREGVPPAGRANDDTQLQGAIVVDPPGPRPADRIFVVSHWVIADAHTRAGLGYGTTLAFNGRAWPYTERLALTMGDTARWRVLNLTPLEHPLHLHGAYFRVDAHGDGARDTLYAASQRRLAVTELLLPGQTTSLAWTPVHPGNWIFHCHLASHIAPFEAWEQDLRMPARPAATMAAATEAHAGHAAPAAHAAAHAPHMAGLVLGVVVAPRGAVAAAATGPERALRLIARSRADVYGAYVGFGYVLGGSPAEAVPDSLPVPGPVLELVRGERVAVTIVNRTHEAAAVHWHGIELESFPDGVPGWSGAGARVLPMIAPGDSLTVRFTPPRAGTFMYHSHSNEMQQIASGMYGAIVVRDGAAPRDTTTDHLLVLSDAGPSTSFFAEPMPVLLNGSATPPPLELAAGRTHRLRIVNIRADFTTPLALLADSTPVTWRIVAKDGATRPAAQAGEVPAQLLFAPGEIYDVEITPRAGQRLTLRWLGDATNPRTRGTLEVRAR